MNSENVGAIYWAVTEQKYPPKILFEFVWSRWNLKPINNSIVHQKNKINLQESDRKIKREKKMESSANIYIYLWTFIYVLLTVTYGGLNGLLKFRFSLTNARQAMPQSQRNLICRWNCEYFFRGSQWFFVFVSSRFFKQTQVCFPISAVV